MQVNPLGNAPHTFEVCGAFTLPKFHVENLFVDNAIISVYAKQAVFAADGKSRLRRKRQSF